MIGGGAFGLAVAFICARRGLSVRLVTAGRIGDGASGGIVGALSPHVPDAWNAKKQFQFEALVAAPQFWGAVAAAGGVSPGYARTGRLIPIPTAEARDLAQARAASATDLWHGAATWQVQQADAQPEWIAPDHAPHGLIFETLSARIAPARAVAALAAACRAQGVEILEGCAATAIGSGHAETPTGRLSARHIVLAAGVKGFDLLARATGHPPAGTGVKGQAALLSGPVDATLPTIYADGTYVVPHDDGRVAVGSTSEATWDDPASTDGQLDALIANARALCPALRDMPMTQRWAGLRPKARRRDPLLGAVPGHDGLWLAMGGFKIGFAIAPHAATLLAAAIEGRAPPLPDSFTYAHHIKGLIDA